MKTNIASSRFDVWVPVLETCQIIAFCSPEAPPKVPRKHKYYILAG